MIWSDLSEASDGAQEEKMIGPAHISNVKKCTERRTRSWSTPCCARGRKNSKFVGGGKNGVIVLSRERSYIRSRPQSAYQYTHDAGTNVCMVITYSKRRINREKLSILLVVS